MRPAVTLSVDLHFRTGPANPMNIALMSRMVLLLLLSACGGSSTENSFAAGNSPGSAPVPARVLALPVGADTAVLTELSDGGLASGFRRGPSDAMHVPLTVSEAGEAVASAANFFGADQARWSLIRTAAINLDGVMAGHGVADGSHFAWRWDGRPAIRLSAPEGYTISETVGPSAIGSVAATAFDPATEMQEVLLWEPNGSRSSIFRTVPVKAGMSLFGMAGNGWIGGVERDGILLTPKIYDGFWRPLPIDLLECRCEPARLNVRGEVLMTPRRDLGGDPRGYLLSVRGVTLLPRPDPGASYQGLNDLGDVVGTADSGPFVILAGIVHELNAYSGAAQLGWHLRTAVAINNRRQVLGLGEWQGQLRWYRLDLR